MSKSKTRRRVEAMYRQHLSQMQMRRDQAEALAGWETGQSSGR